MALLGCLGLAGVLNIVTIDIRETDDACDPLDIFVRPAKTGFAAQKQEPSPAKHERL